MCKKSLSGFVYAQTTPRVFCGAVERSILQAAVNSVPAGTWAVAVSGGADSVALLSLLRHRADLKLRVAHLDHQTRAGASTEDAKFVAALAAQWNLPCDVAMLEEIAPAINEPPRNRSAYFRAARLAFFRRVVEQRRLAGVILAHHADDQAETILLRLLRGSSYVGLAGMSPRSAIGGLEMLRPLLVVPREALREHLREVGQAWREDQSNASADYLRNVARCALGGSPSLARELIDLGDACRDLREWANLLPAPPAEMPVGALQNLPPILAREQARRWLIAQGAKRDELEPGVLDRLIEMACDAASPARQHFPGELLVRRRRGVIFVQR
jgi:tRNA(Ile)-lysidine synthetase-like protein